MTRGLLDTNILILRADISASDLPDEMAISAVTLAELADVVHSAGDEAERARRVDILQRAENEFAPLPFDAEAARRYGQVCAAVRAYGRTPRRRVADLMIAATASVYGLPLYTTNPQGYAGLEGLVDVQTVARPR